MACQDNVEQLTIALAGYLSINYLSRKIGNPPMRIIQNIAQLISDGRMLGGLNNPRPDTTAQLRGRNIRYIASCHMYAYVR